jgi:hypothetical protein
LKEAQDPVKVDSAHYEVIWNNQHVRVLDVHHKAGEKSPMHSHPNHVVYLFTDSSVKFTSSEGRTEIRTVKAGQATGTMPRLTLSKMLGKRKNTLWILN